MGTSTIRHLWKNEYFQTATMIVFIVAVVLGFFYGSRLALNNQYPMLAVASGSMCTLPNSSIDQTGPSYCEGWRHPFAWTLHKGDLIVVQGVDAKDIYAAPFNRTGRSGDIIVFQDDRTNTLIVHRAVDKRFNIDGQLEFKQEGDGNGVGSGSWISSNAIVGRVVMRIPWIGYLALFMRDSSGIYLIIALIAILVIIELFLPVFRENEPKDEKEQGQKQSSEV